MYVFPSVDSENLIAVPPRDGTIFKTPTFCRDKASKHICSKFYKKISRQTGLHQCPYGFSTCVIMQQGKPIVYTSMKIEGNFDKRKFRKRIEQDRIPILPNEIFGRLLLLNDILSESSKKNAKTQEMLNEATEFMKTTFHEIRRLNCDIKSQAEELNINLDKQDDLSQADFLKYRVQNIYGTSSLISIRLDTFDLLSNPDAITASNSIPIPVYKKFEKVKHCLDNSSKLKGITIQFRGTSHSMINGYSIFELLPYVLFENALKYSPENHSITVDFSKSSRVETIVMTNMGPTITSGEFDHIFEKHKRGKNAALVSAGTGIGLWFAKQVCDIHGISIKANSEGGILFEDRGTPYSQFKITLSYTPILP